MEKKLQVVQNNNGFWEGVKDPESIQHLCGDDEELSPEKIRSWEALLLVDWAGIKVPSWFVEIVKGREKEADKKRILAMESTRGTFFKLMAEGHDLQKPSLAFSGQKLLS